MPRQSHDMQAGACSIRAIDQPSIIHLDIVRLNYFLAGRSDLRIARRMADSVLRAERHGVLVRRRNKIGYLLHGKRIANIKHARPRIKPGKNRDLSVIGLDRTTRPRLCAEPSSLAAIIPGIFLAREMWKSAQGVASLLMSTRECQVRASALSPGPGEQ